MFKTAAEWKEHMRKLKEDPEYAQKLKEEKLKNQKQYWMELKPFNKAEDVPEIPNPLTDFYINQLVKLGAIPKDNLKDGQWYYGNNRNTDTARWNAKTNTFDHFRYKIGWQWDTSNHFEDDNGYALFTPLRKVNEKELEEIKKIENEIIP